MSRYAVALLALLLLGPAWADDKPAEKPKPLTPEQAADKVLEAFRGKDDAALKALAAKDDPDPWLVADELCYRGKHDAADVLAKAAPRNSIEKLPAYVTSRRGKERDEQARKVLAATDEAFRAKDWRKMVAAAQAMSGSLESVARVRIAVGRGVALGAMGRHGDAARALTTAGNAALGLGWLAQAASALGQAATSAYYASDWGAALAALRAALQVEQALGSQRGVARLLVNVGIVQQNLGEYAEARSSYGRSLEMAEALGDKPGVSRALVNLGVLQKILGEYDQALASFQRSLDLKEELGEKPGIVLTLNNIGSVQEKLGKYAAALSNYRRALEMARALGDRRGVAEGLNSIGNAQRGLCEYAQALLSFRSSLDMKEALGDRRGAARTLTNIGVVQAELGEYAQALSSHLRSLELAKRVGDRDCVAASLDGIGSARRGLGEYARALSSYRRSLEMKEASGDKHGVALTLNNIGIVQEKLGEHAEALSCYRRALETAEALEDMDGIALVLGNIGNVQLKQGEYAEALSYYRRSLEIAETLEDKGSIASVLGNIGNVQLKRGEYAEALSIFRRSLAMAETVGDKHGVVVTLCNIGNAHQSLGEFAEAKEVYERARRILGEVPIQSAQAHVSWGMANLLLRQHQPAKAAAVARRGVACVSHLAGGLAEGEGAGARDLFSGLFDVGYRAALQSGRPGDLVWFLEAGRAGSLREGLGSRSALEAAVMPADFHRAMAVARRAEGRALDAYRKAHEGGKLGAIRSTRKTWEEAQAEVGRVVRRVEREAKAAAAVTFSDPDELDTIRTRLEAHEALILYGLTRADAVAVVVRRDGVRVVALPASEEVESAVAALLDDEKLHVVPAAVDRLRGLLVAPLELGKDVTGVLVSPMGRLGYVPFSLLFPDRHVAYVPSGTTFGLLLEERAKHGEGILALGDPDYRTVAEVTDALHRGAALTRLTPLPATRGEVEAIGTLKLLGAEASESGLQAAIEKQRRWRAVHFACHGLVYPDRPMFSALALTADRGNDGFLSALEIFRMKIPADLVVMSACDTGKGKIYKTEGIVGLTRAFMFAGAPRVICSLWKVDDDATRALMVKFYDLWNPKPKALSERSESKGEGEGLGAAAALKKAQQYIRSHPDHPKWKHPYYWAAWVLWGLPE